MSPWVATTRSSLTPTMTPQPVPQKRQGAFDQLIFRVSTPPGMGWAAAGRATPAAAAATLAACAFRTVRRVTSISSSGVGRRCVGRGLDMLEDHVGGDHAVEQRDLGEAVGDHTTVRAFHDDNDLAAFEGGYFGVGHGDDAVHDRLDMLRPDRHDGTGDVMPVARF